MTDASAQAPLLNADLRRPLLLGGAAFIVLIGILGVWSSTATISGAVIATGQTIVRGDTKVVQTLDGGMIDDILVRDGDVVRDGQVLLRLDPTLVQANRDISLGRLASALALRARLEAEQTPGRELVFDAPDLPFAVPDSTAYQQGQASIFAARQAVQRGYQEQLAETLLQYDNQLMGIDGQTAALQVQIDIVSQDIAALEELRGQGLARQSQLSEARRSEAVLMGQLASLTAERARLVTAKRDSELETLQTQRVFMEDVVTQLRDVNTEIEELTLEILTRSAQLDRVEVRSPVAGIVHNIQTTTNGAVLPAGGEVMEIVPLNEGVTFEIRVDPRSIDQVYTGQTTQIVLSSFDPQQTPRLQAEVVSISPATVVDPRTNQSYYQVGLDLTPEARDALQTVDIVPGMPVEAFLETGDRTVLQYLVHPLSAHLRQALRE